MTCPDSPLATVGERLRTGVNETRTETRPGSKKITAGALELADAHGVRISMDIGRYRAGARRLAAIYAVRATRPPGGEARDRALAAARTLTVFFPEAEVHAVIRAAAQGGRPAARAGQTRESTPPGGPVTTSAMAAAPA